MATRILVTGANGFIGRNLVVALHRQKGIDVQGFDLDSAPESLGKELASAEVVFHLAGVNRPQIAEEYTQGNVGSTKHICDILRSLGRKPTIIFSSSTQAAVDNPYGLSKRQAEDILLAFGAESGAKVVVFRLPGVFGKWCRPNYNSVVATFCHNIARGIPIQITDPLREIELVHVDDVVASFIGLIDKKHDGASFCAVEPVFRTSLGKLAEKLFEFKTTRDTLRISDLYDSFLKKLYGTYVSYLTADNFAYNLGPKVDSRGVLAEILKAAGHGQIFISRTRAGITRGNHYHDTKVEKFLVLEGDALIRFRNIATGEKAEYSTSGRDLKMVDIPPGWSHSIENIGTSEMIVLFWSSEVFDPDRPDTYPLEV